MAKKFVSRCAPQQLGNHAAHFLRSCCRRQPKLSNDATHGGKKIPRRGLKMSNDAAHA
jgi:hypothetical protein